MPLFTQPATVLAPPVSLRARPAADSFAPVPIDSLVQTGVDPSSTWPAQLVPEQHTALRGRVCARRAVGTAKCVVILERMHDRSAAQPM